MSLHFKTRQKDSKIFFSISLSRRSECQISLKKIEKRKLQKKQLNKLLEERKELKIWKKSLEKQVAIILHNSMFINSILFNLEAWYSVSNNDLNEKDDEKKNLEEYYIECAEPTPTPKYMILGELACLPNRFIIMARRTMFLQYILKQDIDSLIHMVFETK